MRIALLSYEYPPETGFGGIGTYTWFHARALARLGHDVHVFAGATTCGLLRPEHTCEGVHVWRTRVAGLVETGYRFLGLMKMWWFRERARNAYNMWTSFRRIHRTRPFDVVEMPECGAEGALVSRMNVPAVVRFHSPAHLIMPFYDVRSRDIEWTSRLEAQAVARARHLTSTSRFLASQLPRLGVRQPVEVIHNGIDIGSVDDGDDRNVLERFGVPRSSPVVLFSGRLERRKGIELLPAIVAQLLEHRGCAFVVAGADLFGFAERHLAGALRGRSLKGSLHLLGRLDPADMRSCLRVADVVVLPSLWESCPYSCLEAMAARRAIVASDAGGIPELLTNQEDALVVPSGDAGGFVAAIDRLLSDTELRNRIGFAARDTVERNFDSVTLAKRSVDLYERISR